MGLLSRIQSPPHGQLFPLLTQESRSSPSPPLLHHHLEKNSSDSVSDSLLESNPTHTPDGSTSSGLEGHPAAFAPHLEALCCLKLPCIAPIGTSSGRVQQKRGWVQRGSFKNNLHPDNCLHRDTGGARQTSGCQDCPDSAGHKLRVIALP